MEKITSFTIDHLKLLPGVYVSRKDNIGEEIVTTFDIRMTRPNFEPVINTAELHAIEHLGATFLRNHKDYGERDFSKRQPSMEEQLLEYFTDWIVFLRILTFH